MDDEIMQIEWFDGVERLTLNRPARLNALNPPLSEALLSYFEARRRDATARVILLRGAGRAFCSGADPRAKDQPDTLRDGPNGDGLLRDLVRAMRACPQPVIALVRGPAAGAGLAIALACDVIVGSESASFNSDVIKAGLTAAELGVSWRLQRTIGVSRAREMLLTGRPIAARDALRLGLVSSVTSEDDLDEYGMALAGDMLGAPPDALRLLKRGFDAALETPSLDAAVELEERAQMLMFARVPSR